jgi:hypothetical protein
MGSLQVGAGQLPAVVQYCTNQDVIRRLEPSSVPIEYWVGSKVVQENARTPKAKIKISSWCTGHGGKIQIVGARVEKDPHALVPHIDIEIIKITENAQNIAFIEGEA